MNDVPSVFSRAGKSRIDSSFSCAKMVSLCGSSATLKCCSSRQYRMVIETYHEECESAYGLNVVGLTILTCTPVGVISGCRALSLMH